MWFSFLIALSAHAAEIPNRIDLKAAAYSSGWLRLLHYRSKVFGGYQSEIVTPEFFLSKNGSLDPYQELKETIALAEDPAWRDRLHPLGGQPTVCAYPARMEFLKRVLQIQLPHHECSVFKEWKSGISAQSVTLIYSAAYAENPASMFGHTLLRFNRGQKSADLLSYGANFSALIPVDENKFKYATWGLLGGYLGRYDLAPYHRKVTEYSLSENRDLWEYDLPLTPEETDRLIMHLWELYVSGGFRYYFLNKNCSFQLLTLLESVRLDWSLSDGFYLYALPSETLKRVARFIPDARVVYRPSLRQRAMTQLRNLPQLERIEVLHAAAKPATITHSWLEKKSTETLDALIELLRYQQAKRKKEADPIQSQQMRLALFVRSKKELSENTHLDPTTAVKKIKRPDHSHGPMRLALGSQWNQDRWSPRFSGTLFSHDLLNSTASYTPYSEIRLLGATIERDPTTSHLIAQNFTLVSMQSLTDFVDIEPEGSWRMNLGWNRMGWNASGGYGLGYLLEPLNTLIYALPTLDLGPATYTDNRHLFHIGADLGFTISLADFPIAIDTRIATRMDRIRLNFFSSLGVAIPVFKNLDIRLLGSRSRKKGSELSVETGWMF